MVLWQCCQIRRGSQVHCVTSLHLEGLQVGCPHLISFPAFCSDCFAFLLHLADDCLPFLFWALCIESWPYTDWDRRPLEFKSTLNLEFKMDGGPHWWFRVKALRIVKVCHSQKLKVKGYVGTSPNPGISKSDGRARWGLFCKAHAVHWLKSVFISIWRPAHKLWRNCISRICNMCNARISTRVDGISRNLQYEFTL